MSKEAGARLHPIPVKPSPKTRARTDFAKLLGFSENGFFNRLAESDECQQFLEKHRASKAPELRKALDGPVP